MQSNIFLQHAMLYKLIIQFSCSSNTTNYGTETMRYLHRGSQTVTWAQPISPHFHKRYSETSNEILFTINAPAFSVLQPLTHLPYPSAFWSHPTTSDQPLHRYRQSPFTKPSPLYSGVTLRRRLPACLSRAPSLPMCSCRHYFCPSFSTITCSTPIT